MSSFGWLDYSDGERRKMLDIIDQFRERDTRDELGLGTVRDAIADLLFPGTSTIQRRARYFLFVPWMYRGIEAQEVPSSQATARARRDELLLVDALSSSGDPGGTIGIQARGTLKRLASSVYWQGLRVWGIRLFPGPQSAYHRSLDRFYRVSRRSLRNDDGEPASGSVHANWHAGLPTAPRGFPKGASFELTREEASYLRDRVVARCPESLLAFLVDRRTTLTHVEFPWEHPQYGQFPAEHREQLAHAQNLSEAMHGAALLYNLLLAESSRRTHREEQYRRQLAEWVDLMAEREAILAGWNRQRFWAVITSKGARIPAPTRRFVDDWLGLAIRARSDLPDDKRARRLIQERELALKRQLARLRSRHALQLWNGAAGTAQLTYRWPVAQMIINDIVRGLRRKGGYA